MTNGKRMLKRRQKQMIKAAYVAAVLTCGISTVPAQAQVRTWDSGAAGTNNDWGQANNWSEDNIPDTDDESALFNAPGDSGTNIDYNIDSTFAGITFGAGAPSYEIDFDGPGRDMTLNGFGITNNSGLLQTFDLELAAFQAADSLTLTGPDAVIAGGTGGVRINNQGNGTVNFNQGASAGGTSTTIVNTGILGISQTVFNTGSTAGGANITNNAGGVTTFNGTSTADSANITNNTGGVTTFNGSSNAGSATITNDGALSFINFNDASEAENATIVLNAGTLNLAGVTDPGDDTITIGQITGDTTGGNITLGDTNLIVGGLGLNGLISGNITGTTGMVTKIGDGTLTLDGQNTYTGNTNLNEGRIVLADDGVLASRVIVAGGTELVVDGTANEGITNFGNTIVTFGGAVNELDVDGAVQVDETFDDDTEGNELRNVAIYNRAGNLQVNAGAEVNSIDLGVVNVGTTFNNAGDVDGAVAGLVNLNNQNTPANPVIGVTNILAGGTVSSADTGAFNEGELNIAGTVTGGVTGVQNDLDSNALDIPANSNASTVNVNNGGLVQGTGVGSTGIDNDGTVNVYSGGIVETTGAGGSVGIVNNADGVVNIFEGGVVRGNSTDGAGAGIRNIDGTVNLGTVIGDVVNNGGSVADDAIGIDNSGGTVNINNNGSVTASNAGDTGVGINNTNSLAGTGTVNVNDGAYVYGDSVGINNVGGVVNIANGGRVEGSDLVTDSGDGIVNSNDGVDIGTVNVSGSVYGDDTGIVNNSGEINVFEDGRVEGDLVGVNNVGADSFTNLEGGIIDGGTTSAVENAGTFAGYGTVFGDVNSTGTLRVGSADSLLSGNPDSDRYSWMYVSTDGDVGGTVGNVNLGAASNFITNVYEDDWNSGLYVSGGVVNITPGAQLTADVNPDFLENSPLLIRSTNVFIATEDPNGIVGGFANEGAVNIVGETGITGTAAQRDYGFGEIYELFLRRTDIDVDALNDLYPNQAALYSYLFANFDSLTPEQQQFVEDALSGSFGQGQRALSAGSGEGLTGAPVALQASSRRFMERLFSQLQQSSAGNDTRVAAAKAPRLVYNGSRYSQVLAQATNTPVYGTIGEDVNRSRSSVWATIGRAKDEVDNGDAGTTGFDARFTEYAVGYNHALSPRTVLGLSIGKSDGRFNANNGTRGDLDSTSFGVALRHDSNNWYATGGLAYNRHNVDAEILGFDGDTDGRTIEASGEIGKKIVRGGLRIEPNLTLNLANTRVDDATYGIFDVGGAKYNTRRVGVGVRVSGNNAAARFRPYFSAAYQREFGDREATVTNFFTSSEGTELGRNIWKLRLGGDVQVSDNLSIVGEISGAWRKNQDSQSIYGGLKYSW